MIGTLTGLRGLATVAVVAAGLAAAGILPSEFGSGLDQIGLMIVVAVSGFLTAFHHANEVWDVRAVGDFLLDRAKRLLPLYYTALALSGAIAGWWSDWPYRVDSLPTAARAILLIDAPGPLWIVPVLAQLYLFFVILWGIRQGPTQGRGWNFAVLMGVALLACVALHAAPLFLAGAAIGATWTDKVEPFLRERVRAVSIAGAVAFVLACIDLPAVRLAHGWTLGDWPQAATWADPISGLIVITLMTAAAAGPLSLAVLAAAPVRVLGRCFYPVYLLAPVLVAGFVALSK
jgi:peptidoglycan/LPS O-acetylase OafA/YrhL